MKTLEKKALKEVERRLERHPGDAPWSCIECYNNQPCVDKVILESAKKWLNGVKTYEEKQEFIENRRIVNV